MASLTRSSNMIVLVKDSSENFEILHNIHHEVFRIESLWAETFENWKRCMDNLYLKCNLPHLNFGECIENGLSSLNCYIAVLIPVAQFYHLVQSKFSLYHEFQIVKHAFVAKRITLVLLSWRF